MNAVTTRTTLHSQTERLTAWLTDCALPLWASRGINPGNGAHYERLLPDGTVDLASDIRVRVQARQAFVFAAAAKLGWYPEGEAVARGILAFLEAEGLNKAAGGGYVRKFDRHFRVVDASQDLYDHAFILLANAWYFRVSRDSAALERAEALSQYLDRRFGSVHGGWIEGDYETDYRRQNPHMHMLEACLALYDAGAGAPWLARAGELVALFQARFYDAEKNVLFEYFQHDWASRNDDLGMIVEPGHMMEWVWLLDWYGQRTGRTMHQWTAPLYAQGLALGRDANGLLFDAVSSEGAVLDGKKRCWVVTELIKASVIRARYGHPEAESIAVQAVDNLFDYYLCAPTPGAHIEHRDADNSIHNPMAPATTLYHIVMAAIELHRHLQVSTSAN
ncbi:AGE family epimerase/isomerase [Microbulbifer sp. YPW1]|uniref:AGE family epimerase/isomerase n=1 Tax=Microbulbifer sp. YPW1 TaxID=2745199 RepID=UPI0015997779|nr:AGE family epimerase/isomerase [Microbulbifer sp. YPW1]QKX17623.1 AGE family epimerase/isomerase [Microbulbifer sp. YPW1]